MMVWRHAFRQLRRSPGFAVAAVLTLALGIGASTAIFSVVNGVLFQPLPYPGADDIVRLFHVNDEGSRARISDPDFADLRERTTSFAALAQFGTGTASVAGGAQPTRSVRANVTGDFFRVIGVEPAVGRGFTAGEAAATRAPVVVASGRYAERYLGGADAAVGAVLRIDEVEHTVIGVLPDGFDYPAGSDLWTPFTATGTSRTAHSWRSIARLAPGVTLERARAESDAIARALRAEHGDDSTLASFDVERLHDVLVAPVRTPLLALLGASVLLSFIAWANVSSLVLARATARRRELAVRQAVGAGRLAIARQFLVEASVLVALGTAAGIALAALLLKGFLVVQPRGMPRVEQVGIDGMVIAFAVVVAAIAAAGLGLLAGTRAMRDGTTSAAQQREAGGRAGKGAAGVLVTAQVAIALVLVVGAGLLGRSFVNVLQVDPGFDRDGVLVMRLAMPRSDRQRQAGLHRDLLAELRSMPGVDAVGTINLLPIADGRWNGTFLELARPDEVTDFDSFTAVSRMPGRAGLADYRHVNAGYFEAMRIPLVAGRSIDARDIAGAPHVAVISEGLARTQWPGQDPIGKLIQFGNMDGVLEPLTVVGVVGDVHESGLDAEPNPTIYASEPQRGSGGQISYVLRTREAPLALVPQVRAAVAARDPELPPAFTTLDEVMSASIGQRRFALALVTGFGAAALLLALVGLYGAIAFSIGQRTREIGVRMAIGAPAGRVVRMVVGEGMRLVLVGSVLGSIAALALARLAAGFVYGIPETDVVTFVVAPAFLIAAAAAAAWLPARRAARIDPNVTLRNE